MKKIPIDFKALAKKYGVTKGKIYYSDFVKSWVIRGHPDIDLICIEPPIKIGDIVDGKEIKRVVIKNNNWIGLFQEV